MATIWVREFTGGLDTRRLVETSRGGTLIRAVDGHINRGGEFEQRAAFVMTADLPAGTVGLAYTPAGLVVFGSAEAPPMPDGVAYQRLQHPDGAKALQTVTSFDLFKGKLFAIGVFEDGSTHAFYDGARVTTYPAGLAAGRFVRTYGGKMNMLSGSNLLFSKISDPTSFNPDEVGAGFIDLSEEDYGSEDLVAIGRYQNYLAIFSDRTVQIRYMDPDPKLSKAVQSLHNTGTISPRSVTQFGDSDLFYLDASGLRSLRARDASSSAATTDIGSSIDTLLGETVAGATLETVERAVGLIEPSDGRFWLILGGRIFVFSYFPAAKVSAWSTYEPGFPISDAVVYERRVYLRSGNAVYVYGGLGRTAQYDETEAEAWLPYLDGEAPTKTKALMGIDIASRGTWEVRLGMDPANPKASDKIALLDGTTFGLNRIPVTHRTTHASVRLRSQGKRPDGGPNIVGSVVMNYQAESDGAKE